jgi:uncharacterized protein YjgD (DUF1641 family)
MTSSPTENSPFKPAQIPDGIVSVKGKNYRTNAKGALVPAELVKAQDALQDETVRKMIGYGKALSEQIARFKAHTFNDIGAFEALLAQEYEAKVGGKKGNKTLFSYDGLYKVQVQIAEAFDFGPELQIAKELVDECLNEWAADSGPEIRAIVTKAFNTDKEGQINRSEIFMLLNLDISDERWKRAMQAIRDAMRVVGSKTYVRFYERATQTAAWEPITIDLSKA